MNWIFYSLLSPLIYTVVNFIDKYLLASVFKNYKSLSIYTAIVSSIFGTFFWFIAKTPILSPFTAFIVVMSGIITIWSLVLYYKVLESEETSKVIFLFQLIPVFTLVLSSVFLREIISLRQYAGFFLVLIASIAVVIKKNKKTYNVTPGFMLMLLYDLLWAVVAIMMKFALNISSFSQLIAYESWGIGIGGLTIYFFVPSIRKAFHSSLRRIRKKALLLIAFNESLFLVARSLSYYAFAIGSVTLASVLLNTQVFYGVFLGAILSFTFPKIFKEGISKKDLMLKSISALILFMGVLLLN